SGTPPNRCAHRDRAGSAAVWASSRGETDRAKSESFAAYSRSMILFRKPVPTPHQVRGRCSGGPALFLADPSRRGQHHVLTTENGSNKMGFGRTGEGRSAEPAGDCLR